MIIELKIAISSNEFFRALFFLFFFQITALYAASDSTHVRSLKRIDSLESRLENANDNDKLELQVELIKLYSSNNPLRAIGLGNGVKASLEDEADPTVVRDIWYYTGIALHKQSSYDSLLQHSRRLQEWANEVGDNKGYNLGLLLEGEYHYFKGNHIDAENSFKKALEGFKSDQDTLNVAKTLNSLGILFIEQSEYHDALSAYTNAFYAYSGMEHKKGMAVGLGNIGYVYTHQGNFKEANSFFEKALQIFEEEKIDDQSLLATILNRSGLNYLNARKFQQCLEVFDRALRLSEDNGDKAYTSFVLNNLGKTNLFLGNYESAISYYSRSLEIMEELDYKLGIAWINHSLAKIYGIKNEDTLALELLNKSLSIRKEIDHKYGIAITLSNIGSIYAKRKDYKQASSFYSESIEIYENIKNYHGRIEVMSMQGDVYLNQGRLKKADSLFSLVLANREIDDQLIIATTLYKKGILRKKQGKLKKALQYIDEAYTKAKELNVGLESRDILFARAEVLEDMGLYKGALETFKKYKQVNDSLFTLESEKDINVLKVTHKFEQEKEGLLSKQDKQELQNIKQQQTIQLLERDQEIKQLWLIGLIIGMALLFAIVLLVYYLLSNRVKTKNLLLKREQEIEQMKSDLFLNIAHELRTPMTLILGPLGDLENNEHLTDRERRSFKLIRDNSQRLVNMADEILQASKFEEKKMSLSLQSIPLKQTLYQLWSGFQTLADKKSISYQLEVILKEELWIKIDKVKLDKILGELISNALKYCTSGGRVEVCIKIIQGQLQLTIQDTGPGIDPKDQQKIFNRYYQSRRAEKRKLGGVGLGLSIVKAMVETLGGTIKVESEVGKGSQFEVLLPLVLADGDNQSQIYSNASSIELVTESDNNYVHRKKEEGNSMDGPHINSLGVLVVEDQLDMLDYICDILCDNYKVYKAINGKQGLEMLRSNINEIDLVVSDIMMPEMDGFELLKNIRSQSDLQAIPFIFLSAIPESEQRINNDELEVSGFIKKPFNRKSLLMECGKVLAPEIN